MKYVEIKKLQKDELAKKLVELKTELMKLNAQVAIGTTPKSTKQIRDIKKNIARIETMKTGDFKKELAGLEKGAHKPNVTRIKRYIHI